MFIQSAQDAMAGGWASQMEQRPLADFNGVTAMLADDTFAVGVRSEVLLQDRRMKDHAEKLPIPQVSRGDTGMIVES